MRPRCRRCPVVRWESSARLPRCAAEVRRPGLTSTSKSSYSCYHCATCCQRFRSLSQFGHVASRSTHVPVFSKLCVYFSQSLSWCVLQRSSTVSALGEHTSLIFDIACLTTNQESRVFIFRRRCGSGLRGTSTGSFTDLSAAAAAAAVRC